MAVLPVAMAAMAGAGALSAFGQFAAGQAQASAYSQDARNQSQQSSIAQQQATFKAGQIQDATTRRVGAQAAAYGGAGIQRTGTPLQVMADTAQRGAMAREAEIYQGKVESLSHLEQSDIDLQNAKAARLGGAIGAAGTVLGSAARVATMGMGGGAGNIPGSGVS